MIRWLCAAARVLTSLVGSELREGDFPTACPECDCRTYTQTLMGWSEGVNPNTRTCQRCGHKWRHKDNK